MKYVRQVLPGDVEMLADQMRPSDVSEVAAASGLEPLEALRLGVANDRYTRILQNAEGELVGIFGATWEDDSTTATIWMLGTNLLETIPLTFARRSREVIDELFNISGVHIMWNLTDARNTNHHMWLKWCGAKFLAKYPMGINGEEFIEFAIIRNK